MFFALEFHLNEKGERMDFDRYAMLIDIYKDDSQYKVIRKCVQIGISEYLIVMAMSKLYKGWSLLYSLPIESLRNTFVANRIDKIVNMVKFYREGHRLARGQSYQVGLKHFWNGTIKFVGSNAPSSFREYPADMVIVDELDISNMANLELAKDRLQASRYKYYWQVGNPTISKYGIDAEYEKSDQKQWFVKCESCGKWQVLDFFKNVVRQIDENRWEWIKPGKLVCSNCLSPLRRLQQGEWVAKHPDRAISGYHLSQLFSPTVTVDELYAQFEKGLTDGTAMQVFYNSYLGLAYEGAGAKLSAVILEDKCKDDYLMPSTASKCTAGVDVNWPQLNIRISECLEGGIRRAVYIGKVYSFAELSELLKRYNVVCCCIDVAPERHKVSEYQTNHPDVWAVQYSGSEIPEFWHIKEKENFVVVDRTQAIDAMISDILTGKNRLPKNFKSIEDYVDNMEAPTRVLDKTKNPPRYVWREGNEEDHYFHAEVYDYLAGRIMDLVGQRKPFVSYGV